MDQAVDEMIPGNKAIFCLFSFFFSFVRLKSIYKKKQLEYRINNIWHTKSWACTKIQVFLLCLYRQTTDSNSVDNIIYVEWSEKILVTFDDHLLRFYKFSWDIKCKNILDGCGAKPRPNANRCVFNLRTQYEVIVSDWNEKNSGS